MAKKRKVGNLLALGLLAFLMPGQPMHPYELANLLRRTGKDRDLKIKWGSLYTVVQNLEKHGFVEVAGVDRDGKRPERTRYAITDAGREELRDWVRELVAVPDEEPPRFEAALSVVGVLPPHEVAELLDRRVAALDADIAAHHGMLKGAADQGVQRIFLVEVEYAIAMREAEAAWTRGLRAELDAGVMSGFADWKRMHETGGRNEQWEQMIREASTDT